MGAVYRALDIHMDRPVAIKSLSSQVADEGRRRFQQESVSGRLRENSDIVAYRAEAANDQHQDGRSKRVKSASVHRLPIRSCLRAFGPNVSPRL